MKRKIKRTMRRCPICGAAYIASNIGRQPRFCPDCRKAALKRKQSASSPLRKYVDSKHLQSNPEQFCTVKEASESLGISRAAMYFRINGGKARIVKIDDRNIAVEKASLVGG